ncbi:MAG: UvrD-helicase domain-containing protein [Bacilli bacterium]|nr:UvrD-helicase domain-containing protein [Bacilli bacterium]MBN2877224.1 UvrD-helicase domain-containing protein [Bacilli bacterium]
MRFTDSQLKAITKRGGNILVSAGAGSGKTGVLKERVIRLLQEGVHIDEMIILTFTNAAAFEMKSRILQAIQKDPTLLSEQKRINRAIISTFDAFCLRLVKQYHYLLDLPKDITISDKLMLEHLEQEMIEEVIKEHYLENNDQFNQLVLTLFQKGDSLLRDSVKELAHTILKEPNPMEYENTFEIKYWSDNLIDSWFHEFEDFLLALVKDSLHSYEAMKQTLESCDNEKILLFLSNLETNTRPIYQATSFDELAIALQAMSLPRKPSLKDDDAYKEVLGEAYDLVREPLKDSFKLMESIQAFTKAEVINHHKSTKWMSMILVKLASEVVKRFDQEKKNRQIFTYSDIMELATDLLKSHPDIANEYKQKIKEIMIDEYQDTNDLQEDFIGLIANDNLFMVGDIKQSIYGFRGANPKNFMRRYMEYRDHKGGTAIDLRENFRSREQILRDINLSFFETMSETIGGIDYQDGQSLIYGLTDFNHEIKEQRYGIEVISYDLEQEKIENPDTDRTLIEVEALVNDIQKRISNNYQIHVKNETFRSLQYSDIAILIDRATDFERISKYLSKHNIPVNLYSDEPFIDSPEMLFLASYLSFLRCIKDSDYAITHWKTSFYSIARSFVFQYQDEDIIRLLNQNNASLFDLKNHPVFKELFDQASRLAYDSNHLPVADLIPKIYRSLHLFEALKYLDNPGKKEEKLDYFAMNLNNFKQFDFNDLITYLEWLDSNPDWDIEYSKTKTNVDAVKLMTMHKSKGLQFPIVYIMGLNKKFNMEENRSFFIFDKQFGIISNAVDGGYYPTFLRSLYLNKVKQEMISERIRLLYVAFTRAKENLILFQDHSKLKPKQEQLSEQGYLADKVRLSYTSYQDLLANTLLREYDNRYPMEKVEQNPRGDEEVQNVTPMTFKNFHFEKQTIQTSRYSKTSTEKLKDETKRALEYGNQLHKALEQIDFSDFEQSLKSIEENHLQDSLRYLATTEVLDLNALIHAYKEFEFIQERNGEFKHGIIDLLLEYPDKFIILDYKTKDIEEDAYVKQLTGYRDYIASKTTRPVECYLYSLVDRILKRIL